MNTFRWMLLAGVLIAAATPAFASTVSGRVVDSQGEAVAGARVFLEPGVVRPVRETEVNGKGEFVFDDVPPQFVGLFAYAPGYGFGGKSIQVGLNDVQEAHTLVLGGEGRVTLKVLGGNGKPLAGARVVGAGLQQSKVGIPLQKLRRFGIQTPMSDGGGMVIVPRMPAREQVTVKIAHGGHAQEVVRNIAPNGSEIEVRLNPGVLTSGVVKSLQRELPVPNAPILFVNAEPPHDTSLTRADVEGVYYIRLRPGRYFYESFGADFASVRKSQVVVTGEYETARLDLVVAATATIRGKVVDATKPRGEDGVAGVRILLETGGAPNSIATTGESGEYEFVVPEGRNIVRFRRAPGYMDPAEGFQAITVVAHEEFEALDFIVLPIPDFAPTVVDALGAPVAGAVARLIRPEQLGWYKANDQGVFELSVASLPSDGKLMGIADDPKNAAAAMFTLDARAQDPVTIELKPVTGISGRVQDENGKGLAGWNVHCEFGVDAEGGLRLWSTTTDSSGAFSYPSLLADVPLTYWAELAGEAGEGAPVSFTAEAGGASVLPTITATDGTSGKSIQGSEFSWKRLSGSGIEEEFAGGRVVIFASSTEFEVFLNTLEIMSAPMQALGWNPVLVSATSVDTPGGAVYLATGERPATAQTYLVDANGVVIYETVGVPEYGLLRELGETKH